MRESGENYLETVLILSRRQTEVHSSDIAAQLGFSKPSITRAMGILKKGGYIEFDEFKHIRLTPKGLEKAQGIFQRHRILTRFWILHGVNADTADLDACRMEHTVSEETFARIQEYVKKFDQNT